MTKTATLGAVSSGSGNSGGNVAMIASLRQSLNLAMQQNSMLRARLNKIHLESDIGDLQAVSALIFLSHCLWKQNMRGLAFYHFMKRKRTQASFVPK